MRMLKTTITFIPGLLLGDRGSNEANHSPDPDNFPGESEMVDAPPRGQHLCASSI